VSELRPLREDEYGAWLEQAKEGYAAQMVRAGYPEERASAKSDRDFAELLPEGLATPAQFVYAVEHDGEVVGSLWLCDRDGEAGRTLFVYALEVDPDHRGRGHGKAAMVLAEDVAREHGLDTITLNVFGGNDVAQSLYRSLGYNEMAIFMRKDL
jgi:ribosomal protein S18 acetylase RimI-like enzyme